MAKKATMIVLLILLLGILSFFWLKRPIKLTKTTAEPKTEDFILQKAKDYWDAVRFEDWSMTYDFMCEDVKSLVSRDKYIQKNKEDEEERPFAKLTKIEFESSRIDGNNAYIRIIGYTMFYTEGLPDMTELKYENGKWCKTLTNDTKEWLAE